jgi:hypothetical protein
MGKQFWRTIIMALVGFSLAGCGSVGAGVDAGSSESNSSHIGVEDTKSGGGSKEAAEAKAREDAEKARLAAERDFTVKIENDSAVITG